MATSLTVLGNAPGSRLIRKAFIYAEIQVSAWNYLRRASNEQNEIQFHLNVDTSETLTI